MSHSNSRALFAHPLVGCSLVVGGSREECVFSPEHQRMSKTNSVLTSHTSLRYLPFTRISTYHADSQSW